MCIYIYVYIYIHIYTYMAASANTPGEGRFKIIRQHCTVLILLPGRYRNIWTTKQLKIRCASDGTWRSLMETCQKVMQTVSNSRNTMHSSQSQTNSTPHLCVERYGPPGCIGTWQYASTYCPSGWLLYRMHSEFIVMASDSQCCIPSGKVVEHEWNVIKYTVISWSGVIPTEIRIEDFFVSQLSHGTWQSVCKVYTFTHISWIPSW